MIWRDRIDLGGNVQGAPALAGWTTRSALFATRAQNGDVMLGWRDENGWGRVWQDIGLNGNGAPAIARADGMICVFARGANGNLWLGGSMPNQDLGVDIASPATIAHWYLDQNVHIFAQRNDQTVWHWAWSRGGINRGQSLGGQVQGTPAAVAWGPKRLDVFARGLSPAHLVHCWWDGNKWSKWEDLGGLLAGFPCVASRDIGSLDVFYENDQAQLTCRSLRAGTWGPVQVLGPTVDSSLAAFSFGPAHIEVFHTDSHSALRRIYAEGVEPGDDPNTSSLTTGPFFTGPACTGNASTTIHCVVRGKDEVLRDVHYEDGFWGAWTPLGGLQVAGDPVVASPYAGVLDVAAVDGSGEIFCRRLNDGAWGPWVDTNRKTNQPLAILVHNNETRVLVCNSNDLHLFELAIQFDGSKRPWRDLGGQLVSGPYIAEVAEDALPKPPNALGSNFGVPAGRYLCGLNKDNLLACRRIGDSDWEPWVLFWDGNATIRRPLFVTWPLGLPSIPNTLSVSEVSQAGWIGRTPAGEFQISIAFWLDVVKPNFVSFTALNTTPWTTLNMVGPSTDPIGLTMYEPSYPGSNLMVPTTWAFSRLADGTVVVAQLQQLVAAPPPGWNGFAPSADGDPALLILWERYESVPLFHVALVDQNTNHLMMTAGGTNAAPVRIRPQPSSPPFLHTYRRVASGVAV
jgi:hypothetical protein